MQKQSSTVPNQAQHFAQGPKIYGTGRLMNRIPNLINQQMALQHQQKMQEEQQHHHQPPPPIAGGGAGNNNPEDMFAFQNFLAQMSKPTGPMPPNPVQMPPPRHWPDDAMPNKEGSQVPHPHPANPESMQAIFKLILQQKQQQQQQQQQQLLNENFNRQQQVMAAALVKAAAAQAQAQQLAALRLSPNGKI